MPMTRGQFNRKLFKGVLDRVFWPALDEIQPKYPTYYHVGSDDQAEVVQLGMIGIGQLRPKTEAGIYAETEFKSGLESRFVHTRLGLAMRITKELLDDEKEGTVTRGTKLFARATVYTNEMIAAMPFNRAFDTAYPWNPGVANALCSATHELDDGVTNASNLAAVAADFSLESGKLMATLVKKTPDPKDIRANYKAVRLIAGIDYEWTANEVLRSIDRPDTADRATNVFKGYVEFDGGWDYLTDDDAWFMQANEHELYWYNRQGLRTDVETIAQSGGDLFYYCDERVSNGAADWRGIYGTPGA
jgi:hypothetical protein